MDKSISKIGVEISLSRNYDKVTFRYNDEPVSTEAEWGVLEDEYNKIADFLQRLCEERLQNIADARTKVR